MLIGVGVFSFFFFLLLFFPLDAAVTQALSQLNGVRVSYSELKPSLIRWTVIKDLKVDLAAKDGFQEVFAADEVAIGLTIMKLSTAPVIPFEANLGAKRGHLAGSVGLVYKSGNGASKPVRGRAAVKNDEQGVVELRALKAKFDQVDVKSLGVLKSYLGADVSLAGQLDGSLSFTLENPSDRSSALFALKISGLEFSGLNLKKITGEDFALPTIVLSPQESPAEFSGEMENGTLKLRKFNLSGGDMEFELKGDLKFGPAFAVKSGALEGRFGLSEPIQEKIPILKGINGFYGKYRTGDGYYPLDLRVNAGNLQVKIGPMVVYETNLNTLM